MLVFITMPKRSLRFRLEWFKLKTTQGCVRYGTGIIGTGMDAVPNLPKCPVPVLMSY